MKLEIKKIALKDLQNFIESEEYLTYKNVPISLKRAISYIKNPNAKPESIVLYLAYFEKKMIAYRTVFTDVLYHNNTTENFTWLSGSWVHENFRRKGIATTLLNEIHKDHLNKIIFSNFAPVSGKLYFKTQRYILLKQLEGFRYYFQSPLAEVLPKKKEIFKKYNPLLKHMDAILNFLFFKKREVKLNPNIHIIKLKDFDNFEFIESFDSLFKKSKNDYFWWQHFPWIEVSEKESENSKKYNFSSFANRFEYLVVDIKNNEKIEAQFLVSIRDHKMKIPYYYFQNTHTNDLKNSIAFLVQEYDIEYLTSYSEEINKALKNKLLKKKFIQQFYIDKSFYKRLNFKKIPKIYNGDGDGIFT